MLAVPRVAFVLLVAACTPTSPTPATTPITRPANKPAPVITETCLLGGYRVNIQQRMIQDDGETALLEDQRIGEVPVLFAAQRKALRDRRVQDESGLPHPPLPGAPQTLLLLTGAQVQEQIEDLEYVPNGGAKPTATATTIKAYTFFLADAAWNCEAVAAELGALQLPQGQVGAAACVPADLRARCTAVDLSAR
jgi:hypothetical protein